MPTTEDLERLEGLVKTLSPLANKHRGELIEATQWNQLVDGVLEVARACLAQPPTESVPQHKHTDMVGLEWLTPKLRELVTGGTLSDPARETALGKLERKVDRLATRMDELADKFGRLQSDLAGVQTKDVVRQNEVTELGRKIDGVRDSRDEIASLRTSLDAVSTDVRSAVAALDSLTVNGEMIDVAALSGRVDALDGLREALTTPAGNVLSAAEYERRLNELRAQLVTEQELRDSLDGLRDEFSGFEPGAILEDAKAAARSEANGLIESFRVTNSAELDRRFSLFDESLDARVATATEDLATSVLTDARAQWQPALTNGLAKLEDDIAQAEAERDAATRAAVAKDIAGVQDGIAEQAASVASQTVEAALGDIQTTLDANNERLTSLESQLKTNIEAITANATKIESTRRTLEAADAKLQQTLSARITELDRSLDSRIDARTSTLRASLREDLKNDVAALGREIENRIGNNVRSTVVTEVGVTAGRLRSDVSSMVDTEMAAVREEINSKIESGLATNSARLSGMVTNEVRRATADLDNRVERAVNAFRPEIERIATGRTVITRPGG